MRNYILADTKRILGRMSHVFSMGLLFFIFFATTFFPNRGAQVTSVSLISSACGALDWLFVLIGLFEMIAVFSEDFKVKTMQVAIGLGISRNKVVLCKLVESFILLVLDGVVLVLLTLFTGSLLGVSIPFAVLMDLIMVALVKGVMGCTIYTSLTMIVMFVTQSTVLSIFVYGLIGMGFVNILLSLAPLFGFEWLDNLRLNRLTLSYLLSLFHSRLTLGTFDVAGFLGSMAYLVAGVVATCRLFSKHELDF